MSSTRPHPKRQKCIDCYGAYFEHCRPYVFTGNWAAVSPVPGAYLGPSCTEAVTADLLGKFSVSDLIDVGLMVQDGDAPPVLAPAVSAPDTVCLALSVAETEHCRILTPTGCLPKNDWPIYSILSDRLTLQGLGRAAVLVLTPTLIDTVLLRSLGIPASPITGVSTLSAANLQRFCETVGIYLNDTKLRAVNDQENLWTSTVATPPQFIREYNHGGLHSSPESAEAAPRGKIAGPLQLNIAMQSLTDDFSGPHLEADAAVERLCQYEDHIDLTTENIRMWTAPKESVDKIHFFQDRGSRLWLRNAIVKSIDEDSLPLISPDHVRQSALRRHDLNDANAEVIRACERPRDDATGENFQAAVRRYRPALRERILHPLRESALAAQEPTERLQRHVLADVAEIHSERMLAVRRLLYDSQADPELMRREINQVLQLVTPIAKLSNSIKGGKNHTHRHPLRHNDRG